MTLEELKALLPVLGAIECPTGRYGIYGQYGDEKGRAMYVKYTWHLACALFPEYAEKLKCPLFYKGQEAYLDKEYKHAMEDYCPIDLQGMFDEVACDGLFNHILIYYNESPFWFVNYLPIGCAYNDRIEEGIIDAEDMTPEDFYFPWVDEETKEQLKESSVLSNCEYLDEGCSYDCILLSSKLLGSYRAWCKEHHIQEDREVTELSNGIVKAMPDDVDTFLSDGEYYFLCWDGMGMSAGEGYNSAEGYYDMNLTILILGAILDQKLLSLNETLGFFKEGEKGGKQHGVS